MSSSMSPISADTHLQPIFDRAVQCHQTQDFAQARRLYTKLWVESDHIPSARHLAILNVQESNWKEALELYESLKGMGSHLDAQDCCNAALVSLQVGADSRAQSWWDQAVAVQPNHLDTYCHAMKHAAVLRDRSLLTRWIRQARAHFVDNLQWLDQALWCLIQLDEYQAAEQLIVEAARRHPDPTSVELIRMRYYRTIGRIDDAVHLGKLLMQQDGMRRADVCLEFGHAWFAGRYFEEASVCYKAALAREPKNVDAQRLFVRTLLATKQFEDAAALAADWIQSRPRDVELLSYLNEAASAIADWESAEHAQAMLKECEAELVEQPWTHLGWNQDRKSQHRCAANASSRFSVDAGTWSRPIKTTGKIKVAYMSGDFRDHPVGQLTASLFGHHDTSKFEIYAYVHGEKDGSYYETSIHQAMNDVIRMEDMTDAEVVADMRKRGIDILVDCMGHTTGSRPGIGARRAAPIQVNWLGYAGTMGAPWMDVIVADRVIIPREHEEDYSEWVIPLPHCYLPFDDKAPVAETKTKREDWGLKPSDVVYASFNTLAKWDSSTFATWCNILRQVPDAVLWLPEKSEQIKRRILKAAAEHGVGEDRFVWASRTEGRAEHLERLRHADIVLDTPKYNGHCSTVDALSVGVPVVATLGETFATRVAGSALIAAGMDELCAPDMTTYQALAITLGVDPGFYRTIRKELEGLRNLAPLFDTEHYCRQLEYAFARAIQRHNAGFGV